MGECIIGKGRKLSFAIEWENGQGAKTAAEATRGALIARIGEHPVWGEAEGGFSWTWIELLEFLSESWRFIVWEEGDPLGLGVSPLDLRSAARQRWDELPGVIRDSQEKELWAFENSHNLACAIEGAWVPDLWVVREGVDFTIASQGQAVREPAESTLNTLRDLGQAIVDRLQIVDDPRATKACKAWKRRDEIAADVLVSVVTGYDAPTIRSITGNRDVAPFWELDQTWGTTELLAAARMIGGALPAADTRAVLNRIRKVGRRGTAKIDALAGAVRPTARGGAPCEQGYAAAQRLRHELQLDDRVLDPEPLLSDWQVHVADMELAPSIDAISCWGPRHGPAIFVNTCGRHAQHPWGRRATLAHEICHLLLDRDSALPLAEVLGGRVPREAEARARAFAAELLLPRDIAGQLLSQTGDDPKRAVDGIRRRFGVSREIVCWQAINSGVKLPKETWAHVRSVVQESTGASWLGLAA